MTIKIAAIGSFIINDGFNSKFNPHFHQFFDLVMLKDKVPYIETEELEHLFTKLREKQPEYLLLDFSLDIISIWLEPNNSLLNKESLTRAKSPQNTYRNFKNYFEAWKPAMDKLSNFLKEELPQCQVILLQGQLSNSFTDEMTAELYQKKKRIPSLDIDKINNQWHTLNKYFSEIKDIQFIDLSFQNYQFDKHAMINPYDFHYEYKFYNYFLNALISTIYSNNVIDITQEKTVQRIYLNEDYNFLQTKQIEVVTNTDENLIMLARKSDKAYQLYKDLLKNDYILYFHTRGISRLQKRKYVNELWTRKDLNRIGDIYFTLEHPKGRKDNKSCPDKKLIVIFACMPGSDVYDSHLISDRMFKKLFDGIEKNLVKNVYTMRIMDLNLSHGSHFINSLNNQTMETDICRAILTVQKQLNLTKKDIVLYGVSKGGTGSLYYGAKLDFKTLAVDPIINLEEYNRKDVHFLKGLRKEDLSDDINILLNYKSHFEKIIIGSENVPFNFKYINKIKGDNVFISNIKDNHIKNHSDVSPNTIPEQLMILNKLLLDINFTMSKL